MPSRNQNRRWAGALAAGVPLLLLVLVAAASSAAAPDRKPPRIVAAVMQDTDRDARADRLRITYSERVRHRVDRDRRYPFRVAGYSIRSVGAASGKTVLLALVEKAAADHAARPSVRYRRTSAAPVVDRSRNQALSQVFRATRAHGRRPAVTPPPLPAPGDRDGDGTRDADDCAPTNPAIKPGAPDQPDLAFVDSNCDGIDGTEQNAVFASPQGKDTNPGTKSAPKREIQVAVAAAAGSGKHVYAAAGSYRGVEAATGVSVYGGYRPENWTRGTSLVTSIAGAPTGVFASKATNVVLQLLTVRGSTGSVAGASAYGLRLVNGSRVTLQRVTVVAGDGAFGHAGQNGSIGRPASKGANGRPGRCNLDDDGTGGPGGESPVGRVGGLGGRGGYGTNGSDGIGVPGGGVGGRGGASGNPGKRGVDGGAGQTGHPGGNGAGGTRSTASAGAQWSGSPGEAGGRGEPGTGGGGGGGGGGQRGPFVVDGRGNGGGGGGGGGEGGSGATGGSSGGGSFGVYLHNSTVIVAESSSITSGNGARGTNGGDGGLGGSGGDPGRGATNCTSEVGAGGHGGSGGRGGRGGGGGGGEGGPSVAVFKAGSSTATVTGSKLTHGAGGAGGTGGSSSGGSGATGVAQNVYPT